MKNFGDIKNIRRFVVPFNTVSGTTRRNLTGIFCTLLIIFITVSTPVYSCNGYTAHRVKGNGKAEPFSFSAKRTNFAVMPFTEKTCSNGITTPHKTRTPTKRGLTKAQLTEQLNQYTLKYRIEKDAKNQAYAYIISEGKLCGFADFCRKYPEADWHTACVTGLLIEMLDT